MYRLRASRRRFCGPAFPPIVKKCSAEIFQLRTSVPAVRESERHLPISVSRKMEATPGRGFCR